jgi:hypothetical protein
MSTCACGRPADTYGGFCGRCAALQTLGLGYNASDAEIEGTYRTLVKVWHPDRFQTDLKLRRAAEEKLKEINAAHDYLASGPADTVPRQENEKREPVAEPEVQEPETPEAPKPFDGRVTDDENSPEVQRILKRYQRRSGRTILPKILFAAGGVAAIAFLWVSLDLVLSANPKTQRPWEDFKTETSRDIHANFLRLWGNATDDIHGSEGGNTPPAAAPPIESNAAKPAPKETAKTEGEARPRLPAKAASGAKPYITAGLTPAEVLDVLGKPTSSAGEKMNYDRSEIDFRDGRVVGWQIDPRSPIRVKLWADRPLVPGVQVFSVGSSKSDVIALQGTPTLFSDDTFGYGGSFVYFKKDVVVGWKQDPGSVRLRVVTQ